MSKPHGATYEATVARAIAARVLAAQGLTHAAIAAKLKRDRSTVTYYLTRFKWPAWARPENP